MKNPSAIDLDLARGKMAGDFENMIADSEDLLKAAATATGEGLAAARARFEETLAQAKVALADVSRPILDRTRKAAETADDYVHGNPWTIVGAAVVAGALIGFLAAKR